MASKYDQYWQHKLDLILQGFTETNGSGTSTAIDVSDIVSVGQRRNWYGKLEMSGREKLQATTAFMRSLGTLLEAELPVWAEQYAWNIVLNDSHELSIEQTTLDQLNWFEKEYREAKLDELVQLAEDRYGRLHVSELGVPCYLSSENDRLYLLFTTQINGWIAPRQSRLDWLQESNGHLLMAFTDEGSGNLVAWDIPVSDLVERMVRTGVAPTLDHGKAFNFNIDFNDDEDELRQLSWKIKLYRISTRDHSIIRESFKPETTVPVAQTTLPLDVHKRLQQWQEEATDPSHPNYRHVDFDESSKKYTKFSALLDKLKNQTASFSKADATELFQTLNSGQRTGRRAAEQNDLDDMKDVLLNMLYSVGNPSVKIRNAATRVAFAGENMLGELYGWAHAEEAPLFNQCATDALQALGHSFDSRDYDAFVSAHDTFKQIYVQQVGRMREDLPLNLEIDKFYNVIDKVDLRQIRNHRYWRITLPDDLTIDAHEGSKVPLNLWQLCLDHEFATVDFDGNVENAQVKKFMSIAPGDGIVAFLRQKTIGGIGTVTSPYDSELYSEKPATQDYFYGAFWFRIGVEWHETRLKVDELPKNVATKFGRKTVVELSKADFREIELAVGEVSRTSVIAEVASDAAFTSKTFELLAGIHESPTKAYYDAHKPDFQQYVEQPFQALMREVAVKLPQAVTDIMETEKRIFGRILKNDWGKGGAWDFCWGAFYPKGSKRTDDAQLSMWINHNRLEFGFYIGENGVAPRARFAGNCRRYASLSRILQEGVTDNVQYVFGRHDNFDVTDEGDLVIKEPGDWEAFLADPDVYNCDVSVVLPSRQVLTCSADELAADIAQAFQQLFPLVLLACEEEPLPFIARYLEHDTESAEELELNPVYTLSQIAEETGFDETVLARWTRAIERKGQAILYGPPGTGKTFVAERLAQHLVGNGERDGIVELVQFHPAYAYEDFIQGIRPVTDGGRLTYSTEPGRLLNFITDAKQRTGTSVLIVDEINRANLARVFGELMYLLEYRDNEIPLAGGGRLRIPNNVRILGTMNTADRSIALVDHALRRRFAFLALQPDFQVLRHYHQRHSTGFALKGLIGVLGRLNKTIGDRHYEVGITYFFRTDLTDQIEDIWRMEIEPYLDEYFFDQPEKAASFSWENVQAEVMVP